MRSALIVLVLVASACAVQSGVDPDASSSTTVAPPPSTIAVDEQTRLDAVAVAAAIYDAVLARDGRSVASMTTDPPATIQDEIDAWASALGLSGGSFIVTSSRFTESTAEVSVRLTLDLIEVGTWSYETTVPLVGGTPWTALWSPAVLHPALEPGDLLRVDRAWPPRAPILASDGIELAGAAEIKIVGVVPSRIENLDQLTADLAGLAGIDPEVVVRELGRPAVQPDWFVPVGTVRLVVYSAVGEDLEGLPGVVIRDGSERLPFREDFAHHLLGTVGPITAEQLERVGFPYGPTDVIGRTGIEAAFEPQLAGRPRTAIVRVNKFGRIVEDLWVLEATAPEAVLTTIDIDTQAAVERALGDVIRPAAVVVVEASTGQIRAAASRPLTDEFDRALLGAYPPGSTFKVITATALLENGFTAATEVECPAAVTLGGRIIENAGGAELGPLSFRDAFAASCNTAFAASATDVLDGVTLQRVAARFGFGIDPEVGLTATGGSFPIPNDTAELAAASIGQGRVLVSPQHMATVAGAVAAGAWRPARLIAAAERPTGLDLERSAVSTLAELMRAVVTSGTGTNAEVPGVLVRGKTGSAEFGLEDDPATHAWFVGYWDDLAIAVVVERGGSGGAVAAPIARAVITELTG